MKATTDLAGERFDEQTTRQETETEIAQLMRQIADRNTQPLLKSDQVERSGKGNGEWEVKNREQRGVGAMYREGTNRAGHQHIQNTQHSLRSPSSFLPAFWRGGEAALLLRRASTGAVTWRSTRLVFWRSTEDG